jgi:hypothetical protein
MELSPLNSAAVGFLCRYESFPHNGSEHNQFIGANVDMMTVLENNILTTLILFR